MFGLKSLPPKRLLTEIILGVVCLLSVYAFIALLSFHPTDPSWSQTAWQAPILNWGGYCGAIIADVLLVSFGIIAYAFPFLILFFCLNSAYFIYKRTFNAECFLRLTTVLIGFVLFMLSTCTLASINIDDIYFYPSGGFIGSMVASTLFPLLGFVGVTLLLVVVFMISITLLTNMSWLALADSLGYAVYASGKWCLRITRRADTQPKKAEGISKEKNTQNEKNPLELETVLELNELGQSFDLHKNCLVIDENQLNLSFDSSKVASQQYLVSEDVIDTSYPPKFRYQAGGGKKTKSDGIGIFAYSYQPIEINENLHVNRIIDIENEHNKKSIIANVSATHSASVIADDVNVSAEKEISLSCINVFNDSAEREYEQTTFNESSLDQAQEDEENGVSTAACTVLLSGETRNKVKNESEPELGEELESEPMSVIHPLLMRNEVPLIKPTTPLPSLDLLIAPPKHIAPVDHQQLKAMANRIESALADYRVNVEVVDYFQGPVVTLYELALAPGVKASRISALSRDLARALSVTAVRVAEVVPGKPYVGLELPNPKRQTVYISEVLDSPAFRDARSKLTVVLGKDISGQSVVMDIAKTPHLLVAGTTGSGKSVGVNAMIISMLYKASPEDVRFIMIDPKMLELSVYEGIPHLLTQVVTDMKDAANALRWCVGEMERRYKLMSALGVRNLAGYNECIDKAEAMGRPIPDPLWKRSESMSDEIPTLKHLHYIVVIVDEFADLIMAVGKKVEELIARLAQKARAAGIHLVLATQRPSVDVITGLIKANIPSRIAFTVSSKIDSRTILDQGGAESLLGMGDMLYLAPNSSLPVRVHGAFVRDEEVHAVVQDWKARGRPDYIESITAGDEEKESEDKENSFEEELDPLFDQAVEFIIEKRRASISSVQRQFRIGYNRAARIIEQMEIQGILSSPNHNGVREILARHEQND